MNTSTKILAVGLILAAMALFAAHQMRGLHVELAAMRQRVETLETQAGNAPAVPSVAKAPVRTPTGDAGLNRRVGELEQLMAQLSRASDYLMDRGQLPLGANKAEDLLRRFTDGATADRDRLRALGLLRRNNAMTDDVVQSALDWLQTATNAGTRRDLVEQLSGVTNAALKGPLLALMSTEQNNDVREELAQTLRQFMNDPQVEGALWNTALHDPDEDVREEAEDALRDGPASESRLASLRERAVNPKSSLDEQLLALDALQRAKAPSSDIVASMADLAQNTQDPEQRLKIFRAFDNLDDPATKAPLVHGLQDPNPMVREEAADALSRYSKDPTVREWLQYVANNDVDPTVRREALQALQEGRR